MSSRCGGVLSERNIIVALLLEGRVGRVGGLSLSGLLEGGSLSAGKQQILVGGSLVIVAVAVLIWTAGGGERRRRDGRVGSVVKMPVAGARSADARFCYIL